MDIDLSTVKIIKKFRKKVFLKIPQKLQENTCAGVFF